MCGPLMEDSWLAIHRTATLVGNLRYCPPPSRGCKSGPRRRQRGPSPSAAAILAGAGMAATATALAGAGGLGGSVPILAAFDAV